MNAQQLQEALDQTYDTFTGPPRAYLEIETRHDHPEQARDPFPRIRLYYSVYKLVIEADKDSTADYEGRLCDEMHKRFMAPLSVEDREDRMATLIWRMQPRYRAEPILEGFDEDVEPRDTGRVRHTLRLRAYCPRVAAFGEPL